MMAARMYLSYEREYMRDGFIWSSGVILNMN
jgi:hypothetical protein